MSLSQQRILILGAGLLGTTLNTGFRHRGLDTRITVTSNNRTGQQGVLVEGKEQVRSTLLARYGGTLCNTLPDYQNLVNDYKPTWIINTIPQPPTDLVEYVLSVNGSFKVDFSSPAADFAMACPDKCPPGSYPGDKLAVEKLVNKRAHAYKDALVLQIGFIPEIATVDGYAVPSGLSFETMVNCNLLTGSYEKDIRELDEVDPETGLSLLRTTLNKFDQTKGFTCTPISNIFQLLLALIRGHVGIPENVWGRTLAMHSSQVWPRNEIIKALKNPETKSSNTLPEFYGQKSADKITKPVKEFLDTFGILHYDVTSHDVVHAIKQTSELFKDYDNRVHLIQISSQLAKEAFLKERSSKKAKV